jgi:hypothetical protein
MDSFVIWRPRRRFCGSSAEIHLYAPVTAPKRQLSH